MEVEFYNKGDVVWYGMVDTCSMPIADGCVLPISGYSILSNKVWFLGMSQILWRTRWCKVLETTSR